VAAAAEPPPVTDLANPIGVPLTCACTVADEAKITRNGRIFFILTVKETILVGEFLGASGLMSADLLKRCHDFYQAISAHLIVCDFRDLFTI
jgi:hypothetical protein